MNKVSVIIPIYNSEKYLDECIGSICKQSYQEIEIILINDGSVDTSLDICERWKKYDSRIIVLNYQNSGVSVARNRGIEYSSGRFLIFVDSDDILEKDCIKALVDKQKETDADLVISGYSTFVTDIGKKVYSNFQCKSFSGKTYEFLSTILDFLNPPILLGPCFKLFITSKIKDESILFPVGLSYGEDVYFILEYLKKTNFVSTIEDCLYLCRRENHNSLSAVFRLDKFDINFAITLKILELLHLFRIDSGYTSYVFRLMVKNYFYAYFFEVLSSISISINNKNALILEASRKKGVMDTLRVERKKSIKNYIVYLSVKNKNYYMICIAIKIKQKIFMFKKKCSIHKI